MSQFKAMVTFGNVNVDMNITSIRRMNDFSTKLGLTDGTFLYANPMDIVYYVDDSEMAKQFENVMHSIHINDAPEKVEEANLDRAMVQNGENMAILEMNSYNAPNYAFRVLHLTDGTYLALHTKNVKIYSKKSTVMKDIEDRLIMFKDQVITNNVEEEKDEVMTR